MQADIVIAKRVPIVSFHFGLPAPELVQRLKNHGVTIMASATTVDEALWLSAHGTDAIIAQGLEAGGHRSMFLNADLSTQAGTFGLLSRVVATTDKPVIAAANTAAAARCLGASAAQIAVAPLKKAAEAAGEWGFSSFWAGQNTPLCSTGAAADIIRRIAAGWAA